MKILITGGSGQLGTDLTRMLGEKHQVFSYSSQELDITNQRLVWDVITQDLPDVVIHAAAYTKVDLAETEQDRAYAVNSLGTRNVAMAAERVGAKLVYISTDYVFDGEGLQPYREYDLPNPRSVYGKTKLAGEEFVKSLSTRYFIVRTSWVFGRYGNNFVKTMLKLAESRTEISVVDDQVGSPTLTVDLVEFLSQLINTTYYGLYHVSNTGSCSWYEFAKTIFDLTGKRHIQVNPIKTSEFPRPAPRPSNSILEHTAIRTNQFSDLRHWKEALKQYLTDSD
ncbi:dTDP-4-dehydrorhamnose reductase [Paenibacillus eucommiae]|uniref:dTDP-4-dehydrorhamnose reductase n=1 Tax=Paenibacillus eucommiae TaxID=1355755 RepID=A0ABS4IU66_9BACL|nr:dTDP-4-dehydrorhamnose reductase [Paenibacillus eucommiae]MBP1991131.1 dTDP-4-dehydrorhamnose reductase [Paenibacillus eucommiae]